MHRRHLGIGLGFLTCHQTHHEPAVHILPRRPILRELAFSLFGIFEVLLLPRQSVAIFLTDVVDVHGGGTQVRVVEAETGVGCEELEKVWNASEEIL